MSSLCYVSSQIGASYEIDGPDIFTQLAHQLRSNNWSYEQLNNSLSAIKRQSREVECALHFTNADAFNDATQAFDADMQAGVPGTLVADGEWTQSAYVVGWTAEERFENGVTGNATFVLLDGVWRKTTRITLREGSASTFTIDGVDLGSPMGDDGLDLGYDFPGLSQEPYIVEQPCSIVVDPTTLATLSLRAIGYHLFYQWQVQSGETWVNLTTETATTSALTLSAGMVGTYRCLVTDAFEREQISDTVTVTIGEMFSDFDADLPFDLGWSDAPYEIPAKDRVPSWPLPGNDDSDSAGFDLGVDAVGVKASVENKSGALLRVIFHGACRNPYVSIAGNTYKVNASAVVGESIVIDPLGRNSCKVGDIIYRIDRVGNKTNLYSSRERGYEGSGNYVFQRVPYGDYYIGWPQEMTVDLDVIDERGMPPWSL